MTEADQFQLEGRSIILYDGVCGLCNRVVQLLLRLDQNGSLRFAPLESPLAMELLSRFPATPAEPEGVILITGVLTAHPAIYRRFDAVSEVLRRLRRPGSFTLWPVLGALLGLVPRSLREWSYSLIARYRYRLFGRYNTCPVPTPAQRSRILGIERASGERSTDLDQP